MLVYLSHTHARTHAGTHARTHAQHAGLFLCSADPPPPTPPATSSTPNPHTTPEVPISRELTGQTFKTLACLITHKDQRPEAPEEHKRRQDLALRTWRDLDSQQVLVTEADPHTKVVPTNVGIRQDLSLERQHRRYPETIAFLHLIDSLVPYLVAQAPSQDNPSLGPYLQFITHDVFLPLMSRSHEDPQEMWEVGACCLSIMATVLLKYQPDPAHFGGDGQVDAVATGRKSRGPTSMDGPQGRRREAQ